MRFSFILLLSLTVLISCKKDDESGKVDPGLPIQPLGVGFSWQFVDSSKNTDGTIIKVDTSTLSITGFEQITMDGKVLNVYYWEWDMSPGNKWLCNNDAGGFYNYGGRTETSLFLFGKTLSMKFPVNVNDTWSTFVYSLKSTESNLAFYISDTITHICKYVDKTFKTPLREMSCYVNNYTVNNRDIAIYHSKGVGYVGIVQKEGGKVIFSKTLISYDLNYSNPMPLNKRLKSKKAVREFNNPFGIPE